MPYLRSSLSTLELADRGASEVVERQGPERRPRRSQPVRPPAKAALILPRQRSDRLERRSAQENTRWSTTM
jgi:hypothetical protein